MIDPAAPAPVPGEAARRAVILCADDYAIAPGVSRGIDELAAARRLSATSAMVTFNDWSTYTDRLAGLRRQLAVGLHLNLTAGAPLAPMQRLAPAGRFPTHTALLKSSLAGRLDSAEIAAEISRQLDRFTQVAGFAPDFIDGHQHVHVLPGVRGPLLAALRARFAGPSLLVRDPSDAVGAIWQRGGQVAKALVIATIATGFARAVRRAGFLTNHGFAGVSAFDEARPFGAELASFLRAPGPRHLVMCHPGYPDATLAQVDPVLARRRQELDAIMAAPDLDTRIWHVERRTGDGSVIWPAADAAEPTHPAAEAKP